MKKNSGSLTRTQTARSQYDSMTEANGMDNTSNHPSYNQLTRYSGNQPGGAAEGNFGRGPTVGNRGCDIEGPACPPTAAVPNFQARMRDSDSINFGRGPVNAGSTRKFEPSAGQNYRGNADQINMGRGPTRGNSQ
jgi:hypothetical protein